MTRSTLRFIAGSALFAVGATAHAHHGFGTFDNSADLITLKGVVTDVDFINPHSWVYLTVTNAAGEAENWRCEIRAATVLHRSGWTPAMFATGTAVTITGLPDRNDGRSCYLSNVTFADGRSYNRYAQIEDLAAPTSIGQGTRPLRLADGTLNISGDWAPTQMLLTDPRVGGVPRDDPTLSPAPTATPPAAAADARGGGPGARGAGPGARGAGPAARGAGPGARAGGPGARGGGGGGVQPTEAAQAIIAATDFRSNAGNPRFRCETTSIVFDWNWDGTVNRVTQRGDTITLEHGQHGFTRTIHMNVDSHPAAVEPSRGGHSIGRWEGDVLVVDTVGFSPGLLTGQIVHSEALHVIERFAFDPERNALTREYTAEDPLYFVGQHSGSDTLFVADAPFTVHACEELKDVDYSAEGERSPAALPAPSR
jgi:hypothetical protein